MRVSAADLLAADPFPVQIIANAAEQQSAGPASPASSIDTVRLDRETSIPSPGPLSRRLLDSLPGLPHCAETKPRPRTVRYALGVQHMPNGQSGEEEQLPGVIQAAAPPSNAAIGAVFARLSGRVRYARNT